MPLGSCVLFSCVTDSRCNPAPSDSVRSVLEPAGFILMLNFTSLFQTTIFTSIKKQISYQVCMCVDGDFPETTGTLKTLRLSTTVATWQSGCSLLRWHENKQRDKLFQLRVIHKVSGDMLVSSEANANVCSFTCFWFTSRKRCDKKTNLPSSCWRSLVCFPVNVQIVLQSKLPKRKWKNET